MSSENQQNIAIGEYVSLTATVTRLHQMPTGPVVTVEVEGVGQKVTLSRGDFLGPLKVGDKAPIYGIVTGIDGADEGRRVTIMLDGWDKPVVVPLEQVKPESE